MSPVPSTVFIGTIFYQRKSPHKLVIQLWNCYDDTEFHSPPWYWGGGRNPRDKSPPCFIHGCSESTQADHNHHHNGYRLVISAINGSKNFSLEMCQYVFVTGGQGFYWGAEFNASVCYGGNFRIKIKATVIDESDDCVKWNGLFVVTNPGNYHLTAVIKGPQLYYLGPLSALL